MVALCAIGVLLTVVGCGSSSESSANQGKRIAAAPAVVVERSENDPGLPCAHVAPNPMWLPDAISDTTTTCDTSGAAPRVRSAGEPQADEANQLVSPRLGTVREIEYSLAGAANADTLSKDMSTGHPPTTILLMTYVGSNALHPALVDSGSIIETVTLSNGATARLTSPDNGLGAYRLEWVHGGNSYLLLSPRYTTDEGISGVGTTDLLRIAGSIPAT